MTQLIVTSRFCRQCGLELLIQDNFCARCGLAISESHAEAALTAPQSQLTHAPPVQLTTVRTLLDNRLLVVAILFCVGPLGLPALWFSRRFSRATKIVTTVIFFLVTVVLPLVVAWYFLDVAVRPLLDVFVQSNGK